MMADEARARKRALSDDIAAATAELRRARQSVREAEKRRLRREQAEWVLQGDVRDTALAIYVLANYAPEPCVVYLRGVGRQRHWRPKTDEAVFEIFVDAFAAADLHSLRDLCDGTAPGCDAPLKAAAACVAQWRAVMWCRAQSAERSVYPDTESVAAEYEAVRMSFAEPVQPPLWLGVSGARKRGTRLRRRRGGRCGVARPREILPAAEMVDRAW